MTLETERDGYPLRNWWDIAESLARQTFQVRRASCCGTAFLVSQGIERDSSHRHYCFATAWHVIGVVSKWWEDGSLPQIPGMLQAAPSVMIRHVLEDRMGARVVDTRPQQAAGDGK